MPKPKGLRKIDQTKLKKKLRKKLDVLVSKLIHERDKGKPCIDGCGRKGEQSGHFRRRELMSTRWHYQNQNLQSIYCNCWLSGNEFEYAIGLDRKFGAGTSKKIYKLSQKTKNWEVWELEALIKVCEKGYDFYCDIYDSMKI